MNVCWNSHLNKLDHIYWRFAREFRINQMRPIVVKSIVLCGTKRLNLYALFFFDWKLHFSTYLYSVFINTQGVKQRRTQNCRPIVSQSDWPLFYLSRAGVHCALNNRCTVLTAFLIIEVLCVSFYSFFSSFFLLFFFLFSLRIYSKQFHRSEYVFLARFRNQSPPHLPNAKLCNGIVFIFMYRVPSIRLYLVRLFIIQILDSMLVSLPLPFVGHSRAHLFCCVSVILVLERCVLSN